MSSRRAFLLSAAASAATAIAAKVALETPAASTLLLGDEAMAEYDRLGALADELPGQVAPFVRVETWSPTTRRWVPFLQVPVRRGYVQNIERVNITSELDGLLEVSLYGEVRPAVWSGRGVFPK